VTAPGRTPGEVEGRPLREWLLGVLAGQAPDFPGPITDDTPVVDDGLCIDSLGLIEIAAAIERALGVAVAETDIRPENFATVGRLLGFVEGRRGLSGRAAARPG
jgi:acyl carrier protein